MAMSWEPMPSAFEALSHLSRPVVITDANFKIVHLNGRAEAFWSIARANATGRSIEQALRLRPPEGRELGEWARDVLFVAMTTGDTFVCRTAVGAGSREIRLSGTRFFDGGHWYTGWTVWTEEEGRLAEALESVPGWALRDPVTGLFNRHQWDREFSARDAAGGAVVLFDLDDLKGVNDLFGHRAGDAALNEAARALAAEAPEGTLVVRFGGDEFVAVLPADAGDGAEAFATRAVMRAAERGEAAGLPVPPALSYGAAVFGPGGLGAALRTADDALYERRGVLLRAKGPGRIVLTAAARGRLQTPGEPAPAAVGGFARHFGPEWDKNFRIMFARANEHAREFVAIADPDSGSAVVEVAAGPGRITFDGGLALRIGQEGQLLVTDPSEPQLQVARARAHALGLNWLRFLRATAEELPMASGTADLVIGSTFLHFTDPAVALSSMARVARPGGKVAVNASLDMTWGPAWDEIMEPVRQELAAFGLPMRDFLPGRAEIESAMRGAGLRLETVHLAGRERVTFPSAEVALQIVRQIAFVPLFLKGVPERRHPAVEAAVEERLRAVFARGVAQQDIEGGMDTITLVGRRPA